ncbi:MAG: DNA adenine methylase [Erysipelotrichaceae bacterium]
MKKNKLKPFLKWVGGKGQLITEIRNNFPDDMKENITKYAEPFVGGGALLFEVISEFDLEQLYISDTNSSLINAYIVVKENVNELIEHLSFIEREYLALDAESRKIYYYSKRKEFNDRNKIVKNGNDVVEAAIFIFLNKTCFNGLYRVNSKGEFNVPSGTYKNPKICDESNLLNVSEALKKVTIRCADYQESFDFIDENTLVYFDPPYRPLSKTSSFTSYSKELFDDDSQVQLANYILLASGKRAKVLMSNSDPKNSNEDDEFFDEIYRDFRIKRLKAKRTINCKGNSRGEISELLISNF